MLERIGCGLRRATVIVCAISAAGCGALAAGEPETISELERQVSDLNDQHAADTRRLEEALRRIAVLERIPETASAATPDTRPPTPDASVPPAPPALPVVRLEPDDRRSISVAEAPTARVAPATATVTISRPAAEEPEWEESDDVLAGRPYEGPGFGNEPGTGFLDVGANGRSQTVRLVGRPPAPASPAPIPTTGIPATATPTTLQGGTPSSAFGDVPRLPVTVPSPSIPMTTGPAVEAPAPAQAEASLYDRAMESYRGSRWSEAIALFDAAVSAGLSEPQLGQASFLRAEATFQSGDYLDAIGLFERLLSRYPGSPRSGDAMVRIGMASEQIGDAERAGEVYREVADRYADTRAGQTAARRLERLEGGTP